MNTLLHEVHKLSLKLLKNNLRGSFLVLVSANFIKRCASTLITCITFLQTSHFYFWTPIFIGSRKRPEIGCPNKKRENAKETMPQKYNLKGSSKAYLFRTLIFATTEEVLFIYISCGYFSKNRRERFGDIQTKTIS